ncbi:hypothetical protein U1Q18_011206 [Sarracenia purpurea var. burkii]
MAQSQTSTSFLNVLILLFALDEPFLSTFSGRVSSINFGGVKLKSEIDTPSHCGLASRNDAILDGAPTLVPDLESEEEEAQGKGDATGGSSGGVADGGR